MLLQGHAHRIPHSGDVLGVAHVRGHQVVDGRHTLVLDSFEPLDFLGLLRPRAGLFLGTGLQTSPYLRSRWRGRSLASAGVRDPFLTSYSEPQIVLTCILLCILHLASCTLHLASCILLCILLCNLHLASCTLLCTLLCIVLCVLLCILRLASCILHPPFCNLLCILLCVLHLASCTLHLASCILHLASCSAPCSAPCSASCSASCSSEAPIEKPLVHSFAASPCRFHCFYLVASSCFSFCL